MMRDEISADKDRQLLRSIVALARSGGDPSALLLEGETSNAIVRLLDDLGLDGHWFTLGPYLGWYMGPHRRHWTVLDREETPMLVSGAARFCDALELLASGEKTALVQLWERAK